MNKARGEVVVTLLRERGRGRGTGPWTRTWNRDAEPTVGVRPPGRTPGGLPPGGQAPRMGKCPERCSAVKSRTKLPRISNAASFFRLHVFLQSRQPADINTLFLLCACRHIGKLIHNPA